MKVRAREPRPGRWEAVLLPVLTAVLLAGVWHLMVVATGTRVFPGPAAVLAGVGELVRRGLLAEYLKDSMLRVGSGFLLAVLAGVPLGALMGRSEAVQLVVNPVIQLLRPISPLAWIPLAIVLFGIANTAAVFLIFLAAVFPIVLSTFGAVRSVPEIYLQVGANFGLGRTEQLWRVVLPAALPQMISGLRISLGVAWLVVVAAEMIAIDSGLGYLILDARNAGKRYDLVVAGMLLIGLVGLALDLLMRRIESTRAFRWSGRQAR